MLLVLPMAVKLAAAGAWTPASIANLLAWYDFSDSGNYTVVSGAYSQINDKSGNNNHATQGTAGQRPSQQAAAQNGLSTARFTATSSQKMALTSAPNPGTSYTAFCVCRRGGPSGSNRIETFGHSTATATSMIEWYSNSIIYAGSTAGSASSTAQSNTAYNSVIAAHTGSNTSKIYLNGSDVTSTWSGSGTPGNAYNVLGYCDGSYCNGEIGEIGFYSGQITGPQLTQLQSYLKTKWGTP